MIQRSKSQNHKNNHLTNWKGKQKNTIANLSSRSHLKQWNASVPLSPVPHHRDANRRASHCVPGATFGASPSRWRLHIITCRRAASSARSTFYFRGIYRLITGLKVRARATRSRENYARTKCIGATGFVYRPRSLVPMIFCGWIWLMGAGIFVDNFVGHWWAWIGEEKLELEKRGAMMVCLNGVDMIMQKTKKYERAC